MSRICYIVCTLPGRNQDRLFNSWMYNSKVGTLIIFGDKEIPIKYPTTTRYEMAYDLVKKDNYDYYMFLGDDCELTPDFEKNMLDGVEDAIKQVGDRRVMVYPDDGIHGIKLATHPLFTKEWIESLGYFFPQGAMRHCFCDQYLMCLGIKTKRIAYCESAKLIHHNYFKDASIPMDKYQARAYSSEYFNEDKQRFEYLLKTQLDSDIAKLLQKTA